MAKIIEQDADFLQRLTSLLNSEVRTKTKEDVESEEFCEVLKWQLTRCFEDALKIDALPDDFKFAPFIAQHVNAPIERMKEQIEKPWLKDKLTIGLLGHFSTGKTTALNLILSENLPTNESENTALAAYLINGTGNEMSIVTKSGQTLILKDEDSKVLDYATGEKFPFARIFDYIVKENRSQLLDKLTFIDTPGLGRNPQHSEPTISALQSCNAVIWFVKVTDSISLSDIKFIQENIGERTLYVVLSFVDDVEYPDKTIKTIKDRFSKDGITVQEYFTLGNSPSLKSEFREKIVNSLKKAAENYDADNPHEHIDLIINSLEEVVVSYKKLVTEEYNELDKETDKLAEDYLRTFNTSVTELTTCWRFLSNLIDTFNSRCAVATLCKGAHNAIGSLLDSCHESFIKMLKEMNTIDATKLIDLGQGKSEMCSKNLRSKQAGEILENINKLKKNFRKYA